MGMQFTNRMGSLRETHETSFATRPETLEGRMDHYGESNQKMKRRHGMTTDACNNNFPNTGCGVQSWVFLHLR